MRPRFAMRLRQLRRAKKITQEELAQKAKVSVSYIAHLETGRHDPRVSTVQKLAKALGVSVMELLE
jgi:transcriptional regulator with XRE-family HTH domain